MLRFAPSKTTLNITLIIAQKMGAVLVKKEIDLTTNAVYIVKNGVLEKIEPPETGFGKQTVTWQDGKLAHYEVSYTKR